MATYRTGDEPVTNYKLIDFLGRGSYGEVWKASGPGRIEVALKFISLDNKQGIKEFKAIGLVKKLRHPNIVPIHAIWLKDQNGNLLGDGIEGESISINLMGSKDLVIAMGLGDKSLSQRLEECVKGTGMPVKELMRHMMEAAKGIDYLNEPVHPPGNSPIIHCDIKPANLLIVGGGVQVCDYGVARALSTDMRKTYGAGTPAYAAPELINNDPAPQTDQYSLAITYIEMRTGLLPFDESKALVANLTGQLDLSRLDYEEREVIRKATSMAPNRRFGSCEEFIDELKSACGTSVSARTGAVPGSAKHRALPSDTTSDYPALPSLPPLGGAPPRQNPATQSNPRMTPYPPSPSALPPSPARSSSVTGTVNFGDATATPVSPPPPANPWKTESRATAAPARESTSWKDTAEPAKKGGVPIGAIAAGVVVLAAGAAGAFFLLNKGDGSGSGAPVASANGSGTTVASSGPGSSTAPITPGSAKPATPNNNTSNNNNNPPSMPDAKKFETAVSDARKLFADGKIEDGLKAIAVATGEDAPPELRLTALRLRDAWEILQGNPGDTAAILKLDSDIRSAAERFAPAEKTDYYATVAKRLAAWLAKVGPGLDAKTPWDKIGELCLRAEPTPLVKAVCDECRAEIKLAGQTPKFPAIEKADAGLSPAAAGVVATSNALEKYAAGEKTEAAKSAASVLKTDTPAWVKDNPRRVTRFATIFDDAAQSLMKTGPANLLKPFTVEESKDVANWLKHAETLAPMKSAKRAHLNTLATWVSDPKDKSLGTLGDAALAGIDSLNLDAPAAAQLHAIAAVSRPDTPAGKKQSIDAFKQILATAREDAAALPKPFLAKMVLEPLSNASFAASAAKADAAVKKDASALLLETALDLRRNSPAWDEANSLAEPALATAGKLLTSAVAIQPSARALAWQGLLKSEQPKATAKDFAAELKAAKDLNPDDLAVKALDAVDRSVKLRPLTDTDRIAALESCDAVIATALGAVKPGTDLDEACILYKLGADNLILLANADHREPYKQGEQLGRALTWANSLLKLQADSSEGFDALGCAREDVAWIVKPADRFKQYEQAVTDFTNAAGPMAERRGPLVHRGRCRYKWAEAEWQATKALNTDVLDKAAADFRTITSKPDGVEPHIVAEAHYWQAHVSTLRRIARVGDMKAEYDTILRSYAAVRSLAQKEKLPGLGEQAARGLASAHLGEAYRLRSDPAVLDMARAEVRKLLAEPLPEIWKSVIRQEQRTTESYIDAATDNFADYVAEVDKALADPVPAALRSLQTQLLYDRANAYSVFVHYKPNWNAEKAIADCDKAIGIHKTSAGIDAAARAEILAKRADLKYVPVSRDSAKLAEATDALADLNLACALAPRHVRVWMWRFEATFISFSRMIALKEKDVDFNEKQAEMLVMALGHHHEFLRTGGPDSLLAGAMSSTFTKDVFDVSIKRLKETQTMAGATPRLKLQAELALREIESRRQPPSGDDVKSLTDLLDRATREMTAEKDIVPKRDLDLQIERLRRFAPKN